MSQSALYVHQILFDFPGKTKHKNAVNVPNVPPNAIYRRWTLTEAIELIRTHYPCFESAMTHDTEFPIVKCDFFRYVLMHKFGGVYFDLDFMPLRPIDALFRDSECRSVFCRPVRSGVPEVMLCEEWHDSARMTQTLHNGIFFSRSPNHPFWLEMMWSVYNGLRTKSPTCANDVYMLSVPKRLCAEARTAIERYNDVVILPYYYCCPYVAHRRSDGEQTVCNGPGEVPRLDSHTWAFPSRDANIHQRYPNSYFVCLGGTSMWK